jgi:trehalose 6-phosphate phosphatase
LAPIVPDPHQARAHPEVPAALSRLGAAGIGIAVVTGRPAAVAVDYGSLAGVPGLVVLGHYGQERWERGIVSAPPVAAGVDAARLRLPGLLADLGAPEGTWVEDKGRALAVHTRRASDPHGALELLRSPLAELAEEVGLLLEPGRLVLELRPPGGDKGVAVRALVAERSPTVVVVVGDDLGDLAAFDAVAELRAEPGGETGSGPRSGLQGLLVCSGSSEVSELAERADLVVDGPAGVVELLQQLGAAIDSRPSG